MAHAAHGAAYVFSVGKHARLCGSPYENKRPPNGGLLFWQGHKGSNSGHATWEKIQKLKMLLNFFEKCYNMH